MMFILIYPYNEITAQKLSDFGRLKWFAVIFKEIGRYFNEEEWEQIELGLESQ